MSVGIEMPLTATYVFFENIIMFERKKYYQFKVYFNFFSLSQNITPNKAKKNYWYTSKTVLNSFQEYSAELYKGRRDYQMTLISTISRPHDRYYNDHGVCYQK